MTEPGDQVMRWREAPADLNDRSLGKGEENPAMLHPAIRGTPAGVSQVHVDEWEEGRS